MGGSRFRIIGVYDEFESALLSTVAGEDYIEIPYSTFYDLYPGPVAFLQVWPRDKNNRRAATDAVQAELRKAARDARNVHHAGRGRPNGGLQSVLSVVAGGLTAIGGVASSSPGSAS